MHTKSKTAVSLLFFIGSLLSTSTLKAQSITDQLQVILEETVQGKEKVEGVSLTVLSPQLKISFSGAAGFDSTEKDSELDAAQPFRIASITKTYVAAAILRLYEMNKLRLEDPITKYISEAHVEILKAGGYAPDQILIKHCLNHTSGLFDYAEGSKDYIKIARKNAKKRWTRTEQLQFAMDHGAPIAAPGKEHHYSDTGYILLGEIIEKLTRTGLAKGLRSLLKYEDLGLNATWLESLEEKPQNLPNAVHRYLGKIDATHWDNSMDLYGGGGLAATTEDVGRFIQALFNHKVFENESTLTTMLEGNENTAYRMGIGWFRSQKSGTEAYTHSGFWGTMYVHVPKYNATVVVNYTRTESATMLNKVFALIATIE